MFQKNLSLMCAVLILQFLSTYVCADDGKGVVSENRRGGSVAFTSIVGSPLTINVGADASFQVFNDFVSNGSTGQFYPSSQIGLADVGWLIRVGDILYAPNFSAHGTTATGGIGVNTTYTNPTVSAVSGSGSATSPFEVTSTADINAQLSMRQTVQYENGDNFFRQSLRLANDSADSVNAKVFFAGDIYLANSDSGQPTIQAGAPGGRTCEGITPIYNILLSATAPSLSAYSATGYSDVWRQIEMGDLDGIVNNSGCIDNGAGVQWNVTIPANGSTLIEGLTSFGDVPGVIGGPMPGPVTPVLVNSALGLLFLIMTCLGVAQFYIRKS